MAFACSIFHLLLVECNSGVLVLLLLVCTLARGRWTEVGHQSFKVDKLDSIGKLRLAEDTHEAIDLDLIELLDSDLVTARDEVISGHYLYILLTIELGQVVDYVLTSESLSDSQVVNHEALGDHVEDSFSDVQHLLFTDFNLLSVRLFSLGVLFSLSVLLGLSILVWLLVIVLIVVVFLFVSGLRLFLLFILQRLYLPLLLLIV